MKKPMVDECPCCGVQLHTTRNTHVGDVGRVEPFANNHKTYIYKNVLHWRCTRCGAEWRHGEYSEGVEA